MIKYKLYCNNCNLKFDSWFASSNEYERLKQKKLLSCHKCNSIKVEKTIMAPQLINKKSNIDEKVNIEKYNKVKKQLMVIKNLLKIISNMLAIILLMRQDQFIIIVKKNQKVFMEVHQRKI